jgi:superfamily II DNA or RNA helicase
VAGYLTTNFFHHVDSRTRSRGQAYFSAGAVRKLSGDEWSVEARVQGTRLYDVDIFRLEDSFESSCSCPYYDGSFDICKHIWATILAAEKTGYLKGDDDRQRFHGGQDIVECFPQAKLYPPAPEESKSSEWRQQLERLAGSGREIAAATARRQERQLLYLIEVRETLDRQKLTIGVAHRERRKAGGWGKIKIQRIRSADIAALPDDADRRILTLLLGAGLSYDYRYAYYESPASEFSLGRAAWDVILPLMCATGRCLLQRAPDGAQVPLEWDAGEAWELCLRAKLDESEDNYQIIGAFRRGETEIALAQPDLLLAGGLIIHDGRIARLQDHGAFLLIGILRERKVLTVPRRDATDFVAQYLRLWQRPPLELPHAISFQETFPEPKPMLSIKKGESLPWAPPRLVGELAFEYDGELISYDAPDPGVFRKDTRTFVRRDRELEQAQMERLARLGFRSGYAGESSGFNLPPNLLPRVVRALVSEGWRVEAQGQLFRTPGAVRVEINSAVDWFEVSGGAEFGDISVPLPRLLAALKRGEQTVALGDGTVGILPEEWLTKYGMLADLGSAEENHLRFARHQAGLLDALIAAEPEVKTDEVFERLRDELRNFTGIAAVDEPPSFTGQLRDYQREGLGWMNFLARFGFGGCLADDMGLGKTVQALALLEARRTARNEATAADENGRAAGTSLVVVPRSLVFHWKREAERFAPQLRVLDHTGAARLTPGAHFTEYDVVLTTYGTLRRDALHFKDQRFDYCILDEAQAIKNSATLSAKAARLLRADHRLAMSGTPVENHMGELWSLFEFLNPGMLGAASLFGGAGRNPDEATRGLLSRALRPFILRRTKQQVARELPEKTEQTLYCDLEPREKKLYDELRDYYRARLLKNGDGESMNKIKFQALEALLRLRQAACHPGLIDKRKTAEPSAKIDTLIAQLEQVIDEGHKVLVFSQFTSLLAILRQRLDGAGVRYAYLDGRTRDRQARVEEFQNNPDLKLFLISLKAGGLGLNLHAAEYVYLLDPWWNPAVEAQAIDRAHRIGQTRQVFAYRLIARGTVEEKVLELQRTKRDLADAIITGNNSLIQTLTREDLQLLLS